MDHLRKLIFAITAFLVTPFAFAGYAQLAAPAEASVSSAGQLMLRTAANTGTFAGGFYASGGVINVAGRAVTMPAAYRLASNAATVAVTAVRLNPTALVTSVVAAWLLPYGLEWLNGQWIKRSTSNGYNDTGWTDFQVAFWADQTKFASPVTACNAFISSVYPGETSWVVLQAGTQNWYDCYRSGNSSNRTAQIGGTRQVGPTTDSNPVIESDWDGVKAAPLPETVAVALPSVPLPVEVPILNPSPAPELAPQPLRVPNGEPQPVPNTNPQEYKQPTTRLTPSNDAANPRQVDVTGEDVKLTDPNQKITSPTTVTTTSPAGEAKPDDFCQMNPGSLACTRLGGPLEAVPIPNVDKAMTITPESGFGPSNGTCPAPRTMTIQGKPFSWDWSIYCQFASGIRPLFIAFAWFVALGSFFGFVRKD